MWARTPEERNRNRHTGFVCFMHRKDAEDALKSLDETDPFHVGRRIMIRWGKHVKKIVKATAAPPIPRHIKSYSASANEAAKGTALSPPDVFQDDDNNCLRIQVDLPPDPQRRQLIDTVASYVAKDGAQLENRIRDDPTLDFLHTIITPSSQQNTADRIYYKWRVYSFCQGDGLHAWRTEPFRMFQSPGAVWIPPPVNTEAARRELLEKERKAAEVEQQKQQRRIMLQKERRPAVEYSRIQLFPEERAEFDRLFRIELCASRGAICRAMAFCFEKSGAFAQICDLIKDLLMEKQSTANDMNAAAEVKIAQLFVLSDILFNSQQPGVRNAFRFRDSIEKMAPEIFTSLGEQTSSWGRITRNKLAMAVQSVLGAWTNWSVYSPSFLDELQTRFEGKPLDGSTAELKPPSSEENETESSRQQSTAETANQAGANLRVEPTEVGATAAVSLNHDSMPKKSGQAFVSVSTEEPFQHDDDVDGEALEDEDVDGESLEDVDGESFEDVDGEALEENEDDQGAHGCI